MAKRTRRTRPITRTKKRPTASADDPPHDPSTTPPHDPSAEMESSARSRRGEPMLAEIAWEACNQLGGIYTVLRSKVPAMVDRWGSRYFLIGPYNHASASVEF